LADANFAEIENRDFKRGAGSESPKYINPGADAFPCVRVDARQLEKIDEPVALIELLAERNTIELVSTVLWKRSQIPFVCGLFVLVLE
jgi:hypothetical protein